jgi:cation:H+ antiporter
MLEEFFVGLPLLVNVLLVFGMLYVVTRASHYLVDGAVHIAHEFQISPLVIGATVVAVGTSSAELAINLAIVFSKADTATIVGNILGSNLVNFGIELGMSALVAGLIVVPQNALEKDVPLYFTATGLVTALVVDRLIGRVEAGLMLILFLAAIALIIQYSKARQQRSVLLVETTVMEEISHPTALKLSLSQALLATGGGLTLLVLAARVLVMNCTAVATALSIPRFIIGLVIIGPGTSLPEIASSIQAARRGQADLVLGTAFGSNLFNLLFGLGLPALITPLPIGETAILSLAFMNFINLSLLAILLMDFRWLGRARTINRVIGAYLVASYVCFIVYQIARAEGWGFMTLLWVGGAVGLVAALVGVGRYVLARLRSPLDIPATGKTSPRILCATRGGEASQPAHQKAIALAQARDAHLIFLYVFDPQVLQKVATPIVISVDDQMEKMLAYLQTTAQEQAFRAGVRARAIVRTGELIDQLIQVGREEEIDLIMLGRPTAESTVFGKERFRSLVSEIEQKTNIPVQVLEIENQEGHAALTAT